MTVLNANAQQYYQVTHTSSSQTINGVAVTVTSINGSVYSNGFCGAGPYYVGWGNSSTGNSAYEFSFSPAVAAARFQITATGVGEEMSFLVNNSAYSLSGSNLSAFPGTCSCPYSAVVSNGNLIMNPSSSTNNGGTQVDIAGTISSIRITGIPQQAGSVLNFFFSSDTAINIVNYTDTLLCVGDTVSIPYDVTTKFNTGNVFIAQLSDASGSFSNPVNIDTISSDTSGTMSWVVPGSVSNGGGYRIRVVSSSPARTSSDNGINIGIGNTIPAKPIAQNNSPVCANDTLKLTASSSTTGVSYRWTGPASFTSGIASPSIPNPLPVNGGDYIATAYIYGCESKDTTTAIVIAGSGASNVAANATTPMCKNGTIQLTASPTSSSLTYNWSGPGNFTSAVQNPVISNADLSATGDYILYVSNGSCTVRDTVSVTVKPIPENFTGGSNSPVCTGQQIQFSASSSSSGVVYNWAGPNSFTTSGANPTISAAQPVHGGDYYVTADINGCSLTDTVNIAVNPLPAKPVASGNTPLCAGGPLNLAAVSSTSNATYSWSGPVSFTSALQSPVINNTTTAMSGDYIVTADLNGCKSLDTLSVTIKPLPAAVTANSNTPLCAGDLLQLSVGISTTGTTYSWAGPNSFSANTRTTSISNASTAATGMYIATLDLNGCMYKDTVVVAVHPIPAAPVLSYNAPLCVGETLDLSATNISGASYTWTGANNFSATAQNPNRANMQFADTGMYSVTATVNGCTSPATDITVAINPLPFVVVLPTPGDSICVGQAATFNALANNHGGSTPSYQWFINNIPQAATSSAFTTSTLSDKDIVRCDMTEYTKCTAPYTDQSNDIYMNVLPWLAPSVTITADPNRPLEEDEYIKFTAIATDAGVKPGYQWKRNGADVLGAKANTWSANTLNDNDAISVEVISNYMCPQPPTAISNIVNVKVLTSVGSISNVEGLMLYPNPNNGKLFLSGYAEGDISLEVLNAVGQVIYKDEVKSSKSGKFVHPIQLSQVSAGVYMLQVESASELSVIKFRVE